MPSKKSKPNATRGSRSNAARICSEDELPRLAQEWAADFRGSSSRGILPRVLLSGEMGAGKSTVARAILEALGVDRAAEGSPTFAIAHEYRSGDGTRVIHADGYRLKGERELEETGLLESLWDPGVLVLFEWIDLFPETKTALLASGLPVYEILLGFIPGRILRNQGESRSASSGGRGH